MLKFTFARMSQICLIYMFLNYGVLFKCEVPVLSAALSELLYSTEVLNHCHPHIKVNVGGGM